MGFAQDDQEPGRDGADARGDGEVHVLRPADRTGEDRGEGEGRSVGRCGSADRQLHDGVRTGVSGGGDCFWEPERPGEPRIEAEEAGAGLYSAGIFVDEAEDDVFGEGAESEPGDAGLSGVAAEFSG